jgi:hypothetical protein
MIAFLAKFVLPMIFDAVVEAAKESVDDTETSVDDNFVKTFEENKEGLIKLATKKL